MSQADPDDVPSRSRWSEDFRLAMLLALLVSQAIAVGAIFWILDGLI